MTMLSRYRIILPSEHGSWAMMFTPFVIGAGVAGILSAPLWLCGAAALALFLARQPLGLLARVRRGKARANDGPAAWFWSALLLAVAAGAGAWLLLLGRWAILWLAVPAGIVLALTLALSARLGPRQLSVELLGVAGLALSAPAAYVAATGHLDLTAWLTWLLSAAHSVISVLYVRLRIDETHDRASHPQRMAVIGAHGLALAAVVGGALGGWIPPLVMLPLALLLLRAVYVGWRRPRVANIVRFGLAETGFALAFAGLIVAAFALR